MDVMRFFAGVVFWIFFEGVLQNVQSFDKVLLVPINLDQGHPFAAPLRRGVCGQGADQIDGVFSFAPFVQDQGALDKCIDLGGSLRDLSKPMLCLCEIASLVGNLSQSKVGL